MEESQILEYVAAAVAIGGFGLALLKIMWKQAATAGAMEKMLERHEGLHDKHFEDHRQQDRALQEHSETLAVHGHQLDKL